MTDTLNLIEVAVTEGLIIELDFDEGDKRLEWAPLNIAKRVMPVITAAMAQDKARIAELEAALGALDFELEERGFSSTGRMRKDITATLEARNVTDT